MRLNKKTVEVPVFDEEKMVRLNKVFRVGENTGVVVAGEKEGFVVALLELKNEIRKLARHDDGINKREGAEITGTRVEYVLNVKKGVGAVNITSLDPISEVHNKLVNDLSKTFGGRRGHAEELISYASLFIGGSQALGKGEIRMVSKSHRS